MAAMTASERDRLQKCEDAIAVLQRDFGDTVNDVKELQRFKNQNALDKQMTDTTIAGVADNVTKILEKLASGTTRVWTIILNTVIALGAIGGLLAGIGYIIKEFGQHADKIVKG